MRRVVRCSSRTPSRASSAASRLLTAGGVTPSSCAAAARLPCLLMHWKKARSEKLSIAELQELKK
ncbi:hypothetical protein D3C72_1455450 [compost metagenome]